MSTTCPHPHGRRITSRPGEQDGPGIEVVDGVWQVRSYALVREVLRSGATVQAGFNVDMARSSQRAMREPILYMDGPEHRDQRSKIARFFAPATVSRRYRDLMETRADALVADTLSRLRSGRDVDLSMVGLEFSVAIAAAVIGLTESDTHGMGRRLMRVFDVPAAPPRPDVDDEAPEPPTDLRERFTALARRVAVTANSVKALGPVGLFFARDVRPAIAARRAHPDEDVISHLIEQGYTDSEILTECLTYGAAGMVTTREYICVVAWHLMRDPDLRSRFLESDEPSRHRLLHEILRLEPVVGHLYRRTTEPLTVGEGDEARTIPAGAVLDLSIRAANADPVSVGEDPLGLCPDRSLPKGVRPEAMSFGDGHHRCPGNSLAIAETDALLTRLLRHPVTLARRPDIDWLDLIAGYEIRGMLLALEE